MKRTLLSTVVLLQSITISFGHPFEHQFDGRLQVNSSGGGGGGGTIGNPIGCATNQSGTVVLMSDTHVRDFIYRNPGNQDFNPYRLSMQLNTYLGQTYPNNCRLILGDIVMDSPSSPPAPHDYDLANQLFFQAPLNVQPVLGNHDSIKMFCEKILNRSNCSDYSTSMYYRIPWDIGPGWRGIVLHSYFGPGTTIGNLDDNQIRWFETEVTSAENAGERLFIAMHHDPEDGTDEGLTQVSRDAFMAVVNRHPRTVCVVAKGHRHREGVKVISTAGGNRMIIVDTPPAGLKSVKASFAPAAHLGYAILRFPDPNSVQVEFFSKQDPELPDGPTNTYSYMFP